MTALHFRDTYRTAANHLLAHTPLGDAVRRVGTITDEDGLLTVEVPETAPFSSGEWALADFLASLAGVGGVYLANTLMVLDEDCKRAVWWSLALACDHVADVAPIRFSA